MSMLAERTICSIIDSSMTRERRRRKKKETESEINDEK
jgi:hypothetical protein